MYSDPFEYSKLTFLNRHQHENTKISTRNANFCSFLLNTFVFNSINTEKSYSLVLFEGSFTYTMKTSSWIGMAETLFVGEREQTSDISLYTSPPSLPLTLLFSVAVCGTTLALKKGNIFWTAALSSNFVS